LDVGAEPPMVSAAGGAEAASVDEVPRKLLDPDLGWLTACAGTGMVVALLAPSQDGLARPLACGHARYSSPEPPDARSGVV